MEKVKTKTTKKKDKRQKYSEKIVQKALGMYIAGMTVMQISTEMNVPYRTVDCWVKKEKDIEKQRNEKKEQMRFESYDEIINLLKDNAKLSAQAINLGLKNLLKNESDIIPSKELSTALGVNVDKLRLLKGESTENVENKIEIKKFEDL